jgi:hypothetical protein
MSETAVIARASTRQLHNHLTVTLGSNRRLALALVLGAGVIVGMNVLSYEFLASSLPGLFTAAESPGSVVGSARDVLVQSPGTTAAVFALVLLMFFPAESALSISARIAGARPGSIALGETAPTIIGILVVTVGASGGSIWFAASAETAPAICAVGLCMLVATDVLAALLINQVGVAVARALKMPDSGARIVGMIAGLAVVTAALVDLLSSAVAARTNVLTLASRVLWNDAALPSTPADSLRTAGVALLVAAAYVASVALGPPQTALAVAPRLFVLPLIARPQARITFVLREALLLLRHPVSQLGLVSSIVLAALVVVAVRLGMMPHGLAITALAILLSTGAETAHGRSLPWSWIYRSLRLPAGRIAATQLIGSCVVGGILLVCSVGAMASAELIPGALMQLLAFAAVGYLSGVALPYDSAAPFGIVLTSIAALALDAGLAWLASQAGRVVGGSLLVELAGFVLAAVAATAIVRVRAARIA